MNHSSASRFPAIHLQFSDTTTNMTSLNPALDLLSSLHLKSYTYPMLRDRPPLSRRARTASFDPEPHHLRFVAFDACTIALYYNYREPRWTRYTNRQHGLSRQMYSAGLQGHKRRTDCKILQSYQSEHSLTAGNTPSYAPGPRNVVRYVTSSIPRYR
jgi:hypothetical protein